jgi:hypothetical protein
MQSPEALTIPLIPLLAFLRLRYLHQRQHPGLSPVAVTLAVSESNENTTQVGGGADAVASTAGSDGR